MWMHDAARGWWTNRRYIELSLVKSPEKHNESVNLLIFCVFSKRSKYNIKLRQYRTHCLQVTYDFSNFLFLIPHVIQLSFLPRASTFSSFWIIQVLSRNLILNNLYILFEVTQSIVSPDKIDWHGKGEFCSPRNTVAGEMRSRGVLKLLLGGAESPRESR